MPSVQINGKDTEIERVKGRKVYAAMAIIRRVSRDIPAIVTAYNTFQREYSAANVTELDRVQARMRYGPMPVFGPDGELVRKKDEDGKLTDELELVPSRVDNLTEADWEKAGHKLRVHETPTQQQLVVNVLPAALDVAEQEIAQLLALFVMTNDEVNQAAESDRLWDRDDVKGALAVKADWLLREAYLEELITLAVVCGEIIDGQVRETTEQLGARMGKALRVFGLGPKAPEPKAPEPTTTEDGSPPTTPPDSPTTSPPQPASDSAESDGALETASSSPGPSSEPSSLASTTKTT